MPLISIITINYNNRNGLQKTINSVLSQEYKGYEFVIVDGQSTDGSLDVIKSAENSISQWVSEPDKGIYDAMNKGILCATGDYIMFLNSGDYLLSKEVLSYAAEIINSKNADIYYGNTVIQKEDGEEYTETYPVKLDLAFWERRTINHQSSFIKTSLFKELGCYDTQYTIAADYAFYLKAAVHAKTFFHINRELVHYTLDGTSSKALDDYILQMKTAWKNIVHAYIDHLYQQNKVYKMQQRYLLFRVARSINERYQTVKNFFRK